MAAQPALPPSPLSKSPQISPRVLTCLAALSMPLLLNPSHLPAHANHDGKPAPNSVKLRAPVPVALLFQTELALYLADANSTLSIRAGKTPHHLSNAVLSPDGKTVCATDSPDDESATRLLVTLSPNPSAKPKKLDQPGSNNYGAQYSPDGKRIFFNHWDEAAKTFKVAVLDADGSNPVVVSGKPEGQEDMVFTGWWNPDGKSLWYYDFKFAYHVDLAGEEKERVPISRLLGDAVVSSGIDFSASADGRKILIGGFMDEVADIQNPEGSVSLIFLHDRDTGKTTRISPKGWMAGKPQWLPGEDSIIFEGTTSHKKPYGIYTMPIAGGEPTLIVTPGTNPSIARR